MEILSIFNNAWVVGIGGGIITYLITTTSGKLLVGRKQRREYREKVKIGNSEVVAVVRRSLSEGLTPDRDIVDALINSAARRHEIDSNDLLSIEAVCESLIHEVLDTSFLLSSEKQGICDRIKGISATPVATSVNLTANVRAELDTLKARLYKRSTQGESIVASLAAMSGIAVAASTIVFDSPAAVSGLDALIDDLSYLNVPALTALAMGAIAVFAVIMSMLIYITKQKRSENAYIQARREFEAKTIKIDNSPSGPLDG